MAKDLLPKGYAKTGHGQVHYRRLGHEAQAGLVLLHWLPLSSRMYADLMPALAARGLDVIAFDLLGYGRSDPRPDDWSMAHWADNLAEALRCLREGPVTVVGGHSSSCVATELALRHPEQIARVVLDGCPFLTPALQATFAAMRRAPRPRTEADGSHETRVFRTVRTTYEHYLPGFEINDETLERLWPAMIDYLETDFVSSAPISAEYDLSIRLPEIRQPLLLLGAETDTLADGFARASALAPQAQRHFFTGDHPLHESERARLWANVVGDFATGKHH